MGTDEGLRETIAEALHKLWGEWMKDLFRDCHPVDEQGTLQIPVDEVIHLQIEIATPYAALTPDEKNDCRYEADRILDLLPKRQ